MVIRVLVAVVKIDHEVIAVVSLALPVVVDCCSELEAAVIGLEAYCSVEIVPVRFDLNSACFDTEVQEHFSLGWAGSGSDLASHELGSNNIATAEEEEHCSLGWTDFGPDLAS